MITDSRLVHQCVDYIPGFEITAKQLCWFECSLSCLRLGLASLAALVDLAVKYHTRFNIVSLWGCLARRSDRVTDAGVAKLLHLTRLATISLAGCSRVTPAGVARLKTMQRLARVDY